MRGRTNTDLYSGIAINASTQQFIVGQNQNILKGDFVQYNMEQGWKSGIYNYYPSPVYDLDDIQTNLKIGISQGQLVLFTYVDGEVNLVYTLTTINNISSYDFPVFVRYNSNTFIVINTTTGAVYVVRPTSSSITILSTLSYTGYAIYLYKQKYLLLYDGINKLYVYNCEDISNITPAIDMGSQVQITASNFAGAYIDETNDKLYVSESILVEGTIGRYTNTGFMLKVCNVDSAFTPVHSISLDHQQGGFTKPMAGKLLSVIYDSVNGYYDVIYLFIYVATSYSSYDHKVFIRGYRFDSNWNSLYGIAYELFANEQKTQNIYPSIDNGTVQAFSDIIIGLTNNPKRLVLSYKNSIISLNLSMVANPVDYTFLFVDQNVKVIDVPSGVTPATADYSLYNFDISGNEYKFGLSCNDASKYFNFLVKQNGKILPGYGSGVKKYDGSDLSLGVAAESGTSGDEIDVYVPVI